MTMHLNFFHLCGCNPTPKERIIKSLFFLIDGIFFDILTKDTIWEG